MELSKNIALTHATLNVRGLGEINKRLAIYNFLNENKIDIAFLQETYCTVNKIKEINKGWDGTIYHSLSNSSHSKGVAILFRKKLNLENVNINKDSEGRRLLIHAKINGTDFTLINIYAPSNTLQDRINFLKRTKVWVKQHTIENYLLLVSGDFNTVDSPIDRSSGLLDKSSNHFTQFKTYNTLADTWRIKHPNKKQYTYINPGNIKQGSRIDYTLTSPLLLNCVRSCKITPAPTPDHHALVTKFRKIYKKRGPSYWKLNTSVLKEKNYINGIEKVFHETVNKYETILGKNLLWDFLKIRVREFSIKYCIKRTQNKNKYYESLERRLSNIENNIIFNPEEPIDYKQEKMQIKNELEKYHLEKAKGYQIRSKAKWVEEGEKSTSFFLRLEKKHQTFNVIDCLENNEGSIIRSDDDILNHCVQFYKKLYSSNKPNKEKINSYLNKINFEKTLTDSQANVCEGYVTSKECEESLKVMKINKSPGSDGLPLEFYRIVASKMVHYQIVKDAQFFP